MQKSPFKPSTGFSFGSASNASSSPLAESPFAKVPTWNFGGGGNGSPSLFPATPGGLSKSPWGASEGAGGEEREEGEGGVEGADVGIASGEGVVKVGIRV